LGRYLEECLIPGTKRIILGVLKREVVSEILSAAALPFLFTDRCTRWELVFGIYCYYFYLYIDFSGYSDLAIGFSKVLGLNIPENFDKPFLARNPMDFWRRWHISLLNWLNEYILTPVYTFLLKNCSFLPGGVLSFIAIFITMGFAGIWHGEDERYLLYGLFNAAVLWAYRTYDNYMRTNHGALRRELNANVFITWVSRLVCFHYVLIAFMIFSVDDELILVIFRKIWNG
jgi:membrane protein involved in D-alanine export